MFKRKQKSLRPNMLRRFEFRNFLTVLFPVRSDFYGSFYLRQQPQMRVGSSGMAAYYGGTSDSGAPCGQEFCDAPYLQPPCGQLRAAADYTACHTPEQADVHNKRCDGIPGCGEQFAGRGAAYCRPET